MHIAYLELLLSTFLSSHHKTDKYFAHHFTEIKEKDPHFGSSLLLANIGPNSHMTPKIVNGSFAALFDTNDVVVDFSKKLQQLKHEARDSGIILVGC